MQWYEARVKSSKTFYRHYAESETQARELLARAIKNEDTSEWIIKPLDVKVSPSAVPMDPVSGSAPRAPASTHAGALLLLKKIEDQDETNPNPK